MSTLVCTVLDKEEDVWVCKDAYDKKSVEEYFEYVKEVSECISKLISDERIFERDDAEDLCICCMMLNDPCFNTITKEIKCMGYAIKMAASLARDLITAQPDPGYVRSIMLDPRDTIDYDGAYKQWRENAYVRKEEVWLICSFMCDVAYTYSREGKVVIG